MTRFKSEAQLSFEQQALGHRELLFRYALRLTGNDPDANDLVQETYLKAYRFWEKFDRGTNIRAWLCRIMKNTFINSYRKEAKEPDMVSYSEAMRTVPTHHIGANPNNLHEQTFNNLLDDDVSLAVSDLPEKFRTVVILCDIEGLTYNEIAIFMACPLGTVRSRHHRGRRLLHSMLHEYATERGYVSLNQNTREMIQGVGRFNDGFSRTDSVLRKSA